MDGNADQAARILLVDDDSGFCQATAELLGEHNYQVDAFLTAEAALRLVTEADKEYHVALLDQVLPGKMDGIELMRRLRARLPQLEVILFTGYENIQEANGLQAGAFRFLRKPIDPDVLIQLVQVCLDAWEARRERDLAQRQSRILETLRDLSQKISATLNQDEILRQTRLCLAPLMSVDNLTVALFNLRRDRLICMINYEDGQPSDCLEFDYSPSEGQPGLMGWIVRHKAPLLILDFKNDPCPVQAIIIGTPPRSFLGAPLLAQDRVLGVIAVQDPQPGRFDSTDQRTLMAVANLVAQALFNARLFQELQTLNRISQIIMQPEDLESMIEALLEPLGELVDARNLRLGVYLPDRQEVDLMGRLDNGARLPREVVPAREFLIGQTILKNQTIWLHTLAEVQVIKQHEKLRTVLDKQPSCWLSVPLVSDGGAIGALGLQDFEREDVYDTHDEELLKRLATQLAVAIQKVSLFERLQQNVHLRKTLNEVYFHLLQMDPHDPEASWWVLLTAVTAGYSLGFNRAWLFRWQPDEAAPGEKGELVGWLGLGDLQKKKAEETWGKMAERKIDSLEAFFKLPPEEYRHTPAHQAVQGLHIPVQRGDSGALAQAVFRQIPVVGQPGRSSQSVGEWIARLNLAEFAVVPLSFRDRTILLIADYRFVLRSIDQELLRLLSELCRGVIMVIDNQLLRLEFERQLEVLNRHYQIATALRTIPKPDDVIHLILDALAELYQLDTCTFGEYDPGRQLLIFNEEHQLGLPAPVTRKVTDLPPGYWERIQGSSDPLVFENLDQFPEVRRVLVHQDLASFVVLPVKGAEGKLLGLFTLGRRGALTLQPTDLPLVKTLADQASLALQNARLFEETTRLNRNQELLLQIATDLSKVAIQDEKALYELITARALALSGAPCIAFYPFRSGTQYYDVDRVKVIGQRLDKKPNEAKDRQNFRSMTGQVIRRGRLVVEDVALKYDIERKVRIFTKKDGFMDREGIRSFVGISLQVGDQSLGVLFWNFREPRRFSTGDLQLWDTFAALAAVAIQAAQQHARASRLSRTRKAALEGLKEVELLLGQAARPSQQISQVLIETAVQLTRAKYGSFFAVNETSREIEAVARINVPENVPKVITRLGETGITGWVANKKRTARARDIRQPPWNARYTVQNPDTRSELAVPILVGAGRTVAGIIDLESDKVAAFSQDDQEIVEALAAAAAVAFRNKELYEQALQRQKHSQALVKAARRISESLERKKILDGILESAVRLSGAVGNSADLGMILLFDPPSNSLEFINIIPAEHYPKLRTALGDRIALPEGMRLPDGSRKKGVSGRVFLTGQSEIVDDLLHDPDYIPYPPGHNAMVCALAVPLKIGSAKLGVIMLESRTASTFDRDDLNSLEQLAQHAALAIRNSETIEELERKRAELAASTTVAWAGVIGSSLAHDIKGYAAAIRNNAQEIQGLRPDLTALPATEIPLSELLTSAERILSATEHLKLAPEEQGDRVNFQDLLLERIGDWRKLYAGASLEWVFDPQPFYFQPRVRVNRLALATALDKLVDNAVVALRNEPDRRITFHLFIESQRVYLDISNTGPRIPKSIERLLFKSRIPKAPGDRGLGMGLMIVKVLMLAHGGDVHLHQNRSRQVTFRLWLPVEKYA